MERKVFTKESKQEAVRLSYESGKTVTQIARELGIHPNYLYRWRSLAQNEGKDAFRGKGNLKAEDAEMQRLRRELANVKEERDILKKALAIFSDYQNS